MEQIEWHRGFEESRAARLCAYTLVAAGEGILLLFTGAIFVGLLAMGGTIVANPELLALVVLFALVGGPISLLYLWPLLTDPEQRRGIFWKVWLADFSRTHLVVAAIVGLVVHVVAFLVFQYSPFILAAAGAIVGVIGMELLLSAGEIDSEARTMTVRPGYDASEDREQTADLDDWTALATYRLGPVTLLRPSYVQGKRRGQPRLLAVPTWVADEATPAFAAGVETPTPPAERDPDPLAAVALAVFGLGFAAVAGAIWLLDVAPAGIRLWSAAVFAAISVLFVGLAFSEW